MSKSYWNRWWELHFTDRPRGERSKRPLAARRTTPLMVEHLESRSLLAAVPAGLVSWYRAEGDASDFAGGNEGVLEGGTTFTAGKVGQAFLFDGVDDRVSIPDIDNSLEPASNFTVEAWVNPSQPGPGESGHGRPIAEKRAGNANSYTFETTDAPFGPSAGLQFVVWIGGVQQNFLQTPPGVLQNNTWQHVAATYDGTNLRIFVDGVERAKSENLSGAIDNKSVPTVIGLNSVAAFAWKGAIDEISFYNRALSPAELQGIVDAGSDGKALPDTYDAAGDFSLTGNPNGAWSYGWSASLSGAFVKDVVTRSSSPVPGLQSWDGPISGFFPVISKNITNATVVVSTVTWLPGQMVNHPGPSGEYSVLRWTAPQAGEVEVSASFSGADSTTTDVHLLFNDTAIAGCDGNVNGFGPGPSCSKTLVVEVGDTIDFVVGMGTGIANYSNDSTGVDAQITFVDVDPPDPTPESDLSVTISDSPDPVAPASNITYTITVTNNGPRDATNVTITDAVPANTSFVSFTTIAGGTSTTPAVGGSGTITSTTSSLAAGTSAAFILVVKVSSSADLGTLSNSVFVSGSLNDPNTANNTANATTIVQLQTTDLVVSMSDQPDPVSIGTNLTYTITVTNAGPVEARGVTVSTATPAHTTFQSVTAPSGWIASTPTVGATGATTLTNVSLLAGASATFTAVVQVDQGLGDGIILSNTVNVASDNPEFVEFDVFGFPNNNNNSRTVTTTVDGLRTDLAVVVTSDDMPEFLQPGSMFHFDILVTNASAAAVEASNVSVRLGFANAALVDQTMPAGWTFTFLANFTGFRIPTMLAGAEARFRVGFRVKPEAVLLSSFQFSALVDGAGRDTDAANDSYSLTKTVYGSVNDLAVSGHSVSSNSVDPGQVLTYTITVTNYGPTPVSGVTFHDEATVYEEYVSGGAFGPFPLILDGTTSQGTLVRHQKSGFFGSAGSIDAYLGTLAGGASATITLTTTVPEFPGLDVRGLDILNVASVTASQHDPIIGNNVSTRVIEIQAEHFDSPFSDYGRFHQAVYYVTESAGTIGLGVGPADPFIYIFSEHNTEDLTAIAGTDYTKVSIESGSFGVFPGPVFIPILDNDEHQGNRSFKVRATVQQLDGFFFTSTDSVTVTIFDDEAPPTLGPAVWNSNFGGLWTDPANWAGGIVPQLGDNVIIDVTGVDITVQIPTGDFSIGGLLSNENLVVEGGLLTVNGPTVLRNLDIRPGAAVALAGDAPASMQGGTLNNAGTLSWTRSGNLNFTDGAKFNNAGTLQVLAGALELADGTSTGRFEVAAGAALIFVGSFAWNSGTTFVGAGDIRVDPAEPCCAVVVNGNVSLPNLEVSQAGDLRVAGTLTSASPIQINGGTLSGTGQINANVVNAGRVRPGNSPGILTINGDYTQTAAGILEIELAGAIAGSQYDQLRITGKAILAGAVNFVLADGFTPRFGDNFQVLTAPVTTGRLTSTNAQFAVGSDGSLSAHVPITESTPGKVRGSGAVGSRSRIFSFDVRAANKNGTLQFSGRLQFQDRARRIKLQSTAITALQRQPGGQVLLQGIARVNGKTGYYFTVRFDGSAKQRDPHARFRIVIVGPGNFFYDSAR